MALAPSIVYLRQSVRIQTLGHGDMRFFAREDQCSESRLPRDTSAVRQSDCGDCGLRVRRALSELPNSVRLRQLCCRITNNVPQLTHCPSTCAQLTLGSVQFSFNNHLGSDYYHVWAPGSLPLRQETFKLMNKAS